jgi:hypothetical protein
MQAQRGQAIAETVVFLPLFLLALFGMIWMVQVAVQYERVESAVRYAGLISQQVNPYEDYSLYSLYTQLNAPAMPTMTCASPSTDTLTDAAPTYTSSQTLTASPPFWSPSSSQAGCASYGLIGLKAGTGLSQDVILSQQQPSMASTVSAVGTIGLSSSTPIASAYFFRPIGIDTILACYPTLDTQVTNSLRYAADTSTPTQPVALSNSVTPLTPVVSTQCSNW